MPLRHVSLVKYTDDTYLLISACNVDTRDIEIANIDTWSQANNLKLIEPGKVCRDRFPRPLQAALHPTASASGWCHACDVAESTRRHIH